MIFYIKKINRCQILFFKHATYLICFSNKNKLESNESMIKDLIGLNELNKLNDLNELKCGKVFNLNKEEERDVIDGNRKYTTRQLCNKVIKNYKNTFDYSVYLSNRENINNLTEDLYIDVSNQYIYESNIYFKDKSKVSKGNRSGILFRNAIIIRNITPDIDLETLATKYLLSLEYWMFVT